MYVCMYVCLSIMGFTIEIYGYMHSLHTFLAHVGHTVDRENFAVKIISRSRTTAKIKHAKNKITRQ